MRLLLDTQIFLCVISNSMKLSSKARVLITSAIGVYVSSVSIWESHVKIKQGKLDANIEDLINAISDSGFNELSLLSNHVATFTQLKNFHQDPFERMLVAQALCEPLKLLTNNTNLKKYTDLVIIV